MIKKLINIFYSNIITIFNNVIKKKYHEDSKKNIHLNDNRFLNSVKKLKFNKKNDISDHFENIFYETFLIKPELILELGVRSGESTGIFIQVCEMINSDLISIDLEDCSNVIKSDKWKFIKYNSINFLQEYDTWSKSNGYNIPDVIFIDTSHLYEETLVELELSSKLLKKDGAIMLHDTNHNYINFYENGIFYKKINYNIQDGVKKALNEFLGIKLNLNSNFILIKDNWLIKHYSTSFGFTILKKLK